MKPLPRSLYIAAALALLLHAAAARADDAPPALDGWLSTEDGAKTLSRIDEKSLAFQSAKRAPKRALRIDDTQQFQTILGLGSSFEHTTCQNLMLLPPDERQMAVSHFVSDRDGIGMNLMRVCMGTPDFTGEPWYSYNDMPAGDRDPELKNFSIEKDRKFVLPVLRLALQENPTLLLFASPWSPPGWMKSTGTMIGGHLLPENYATYAQYFVKFIQAYAAEGIAIHAVTVQNEPGVDRAKEKDPKWFYPSCRWTGEQERDFIRDHLGPAFETAGLNTEIWTYDHNYNTKPTPDGDDPGLAYPRTVLSDPGARKFVDGVAFHGYAGSPDGMGEFAREFPEVPLSFTEGSVFGARGAAKIIRYFQNGASSYNAWVTLTNDRGGPNNGPFEADRTMATLESSTLEVTYHPDYDLYGQFMKYIARGARRIAAESQGSGVDAVAFRNPDGKIVVVVVNTSTQPVEFSLHWQDWAAPLKLPAASVATFSWKPQP